jgi:uncharacterized OB-fold protein
MSIKKTLTGGHYFSYVCPQCDDALRSPLAEVGTNQSCPQCGVVHVVPGKREAEEFLVAEEVRKGQKAAERQRQKAERAQRKARAKQEAEFVPPSIDAYDDDVESDSSGDTGEEGRLVKCPDCARDVSPLAVSCPHCGRPINEQKVCSSEEGFGPTGYVRKNLVPGETMLYAASIHPLIFLPSAILFICPVVGVTVFKFYPLICIVLILLGLSSPFFAIKSLIVFLTTECVLTDRRVLAKTGLISRESLELLLSKVEGLQVQQSILGRVFNFGTVVISGTGGSTSPFSGIARPLKFRKRLQEQIAKIQT